MQKYLISVLSYSTIRKALSLCVLVLIASFIGYMIEVLWVALRHGYIDNRGMYLPFLLGYGLAMLVIFALFGTPDNPKLYFLQEYATDSNVQHLLYALEVFVFVTVCESLFGNLVYHVCHVKWWNYNSIPLHIGQYTSIPTSIGFTTCIYLFMQRVFVPVYTYLSGTDIECYGLFILFLCALVALDCVHGLCYMYKHQTVKLLFREELHNPPLFRLWKHSF